ncbi:MAG TPA: FtsX-like permease family protein [Casimicrobiaceae bacterium]|nr:FtsX-like permease family protein [Casimicrobiaceae bacterium]
MRRRAFLAAPLALAGPVACAAASDGAYPAVVPGATLAFPRDHGSHPAYRTEWWYITGWVRDGDGRDLGVQVTFFRNRPNVAEHNPSALEPKQLVFAHAAIADPAFGALVLARRREFGVLRHLGMTRGQVGRMLATEGVVTSAIGVGAGLLLGALISLILIYVVNRQSFHWGMDLAMPWPQLAAFAVVVVALATLTAVASGRQAMGPDVVRAVKDDW